MDVVSDFLIRIKNAALAGKQTVFSPYSKNNQALAEILQKQGFLEKTEVTEEEKVKKLKITLPKKGHKIYPFDVKRISKPGRRVYFQTADLKKLRGLWVTIISTPAGLMEAREAIKNNHGGEVICKIMKN